MSVGCCSFISSEGNLSTSPPQEPPEGFLLAPKWCLAPAALQRSAMAPLSQGVRGEEV